jgi:predicted DCC family thiol-disulfide oxidoreductase YuxK
MPESATTLEKQVTPDAPIVFFDGVCGLCNRSIDFVLRHDRRGVFRAAPLQGETAAGLLTPTDRESLHTLVLHTGDRSYRRSAAVVRILWNLGPWWRPLAVLLWLIPLPLRDLGYKLVARNRYRFLGKRETCRMPTPEERERLLP